MVISLLSTLYCNLCMKVLMIIGGYDVKYDVKEGIVLKEGSVHIDSNFSDSVDFIFCF